jgi:SAM-dependent methyltransferase
MGKRAPAVSTGIVEWPVPTEFVSSPAVQNRNLKAEKHHRQDPDTILRTYIHMDRTQVIKEFTSVFRILYPFQFRGRGMEIGAGTASFSAMVCREFPEVESIYAVEVVPSVVKLLQPVLVKHIAGDLGGKITGVIGSFDDIRLESNSCDFCIEIGSLHHSDNLPVTLNEIARTLRPGGHLVMLDRAHNNRLSDRQREIMLDLEYSDVWKRKNGYPSDPLTRRQNGEHEIRIREWEEHLKTAGFVVERRIELRPVSWKKFLRSCALEVPFALRKRTLPDPMQVVPHSGETWWMLRYLLGVGNRTSNFFPAQRKQSIFIARKI